MNKYKTAAKHTMYVAIGTIGSKLMYILMLPLYTRWLKTSEFGITDTLITIADITVAILFLNIAESIFVYPKNATQKKQIEFFSSGLLFMIFVMILIAICFTIYDLINIECLKNSFFLNYHWLLYILVTSRYIQVYIQSFVRSLNKMKIYSSSGIILTVLIAVLSILLIPSFNIHGYILSIALAHIITAIVCFCIADLHKYFSIKSFNYNSLKELLKYSIPLAPSSIMWWLINGINRPIMSAVMGFSSIGIYAVATRISGVINSLSEVLGTAWGNSVLDEYNKNGFEEFYNNYLRFLISAYFFIGLIIMLLSNIIVRLFSTPDYYSASIYIPILVLGLIYSGISSCVGQIFSAVKKSRYFFYSSLYGGLSSVLSLIILIKPFGLYGVSISMCVSFLVIFIARCYFAAKFIKLYNLNYVVILSLAYILSLICYTTFDGLLSYLIPTISIIAIVIYSRNVFIGLFYLLKLRYKKL